MLNKKRLIEKLGKFLKTETPSGFADGLMFTKYNDLLNDLKKGEVSDFATLNHFLSRGDKNGA